MNSRETCKRFEGSPHVISSEWPLGKPRLFDVSTHAHCSLYSDEATQESLGASIRNPRQTPCFSKVVLGRTVSLTCWLYFLSVINRKKNVPRRKKKSYNTFVKGLRR